MRIRPKSPSLIDPHLFADIARESDSFEQSECRPLPHEVVEWHLTYIAEAYLPSHAEQLAKGLAQEGWDVEFVHRRQAGIVPQMRASPYGGGWSNLGVLVPQASIEWGGIRVAQVPDGVASVSLQLWSVTGSLTILVAGFQWSDESAEALDHVAWTDYQTAVIPAKGGRSHYSPYMLKALEARRLRRIRHRRVAAWLTEKVPGLYHELGSPLPALDVITLAQGRPYCEDPPLKTYDYREALGLEGGVEVAASASMPGWKLGLHSSELPTVLTLGARTAEVFDDRVLKYHGEVSRSAMSSFLDRRAASLLCSWAATLVIPTLHEQLVRVRDRAPVRRESSVSFARRLSHDTTVALRHGVDSAAFCDDVLNRPAEAGPARVLRTVDFVVEYPPYRGGLLGERWVKWIAQEAEAMRRVERGQRERLATEAQLTGLVVDIRTQVQMRRLTIAAVAFSVIAVVVAVLQLLLAD